MLLSRLFRSPTAYLGLFLFLAGPTRGAVLLVEPFNYTNGVLTNVSAGVWASHSGPSNELQVVSGRAVLDRNLGEDVNFLLPGQPYPITTNTVLYASFTVNFSTLPSAGGNYFTHFKAGGLSNFRSKVFALTSGADSGKFRLAISGGSNDAVATNLPSLSLNTSYRVFIRYGVSNALATLWVDPTSELSPSVTATDASAGTLTSFALRQESGIGVLTVDDLRIGMSFAEVYADLPPSITQQPADVSTVEGGTATFAVAASGTAPLQYQWKFNNSNLLNATNTTLTLTNVSAAQAGSYSVTVTNVAGFTNSAAATLTVIQPNSNGTFSVVHYNVKGNFASDWTTNAPQVRAIARQLQYLNPDAIMLNEIPSGFRHEMTNWMIAFFPAYYLAVATNNDNLRSGIISRFPIARSQSWLNNASLTNFGYAGTYTRDLFEAQITVPGATEPLHLFTTHLKSGPAADEQDQRAAECSAVSNFFATVFVPTNGSRPYALVGDWNEDIAIPLSHSNQPIQRLVSAPTGLKLTTPLNPFTLSRFTHSIQGNSNSLDARFDYISPAGVLASNIVTSQIFRTDLLPPPFPPNLNSNDNIVASDHLPVQMVFNYPDPPLRTTLEISNQTVVLRWPALIGRRFRIDASTNLTSWTAVASNVHAFSAQPVWAGPLTNPAQFYRVLRIP